MSERYSHSLEIPEGQITVYIPKEMSIESCADVKQFFELLMRAVERKALAAVTAKIGQND